MAAVVSTESQAGSKGTTERVTQSRAEYAARAALRALWFGIIPALLAALVVHDFVPPLPIGGGESARDAVRLAQEYPVPLGVGLFLLFAAAARHWRFALPGGHHLSTLATPLAARLPVAQRRTFVDAAALDASLSAARMRRKLDRALGAGRFAELDAQLQTMRAAMYAGDEKTVHESSMAVRALAARVLAKRQWLDLAGLVLAMAAVAGFAFGVRGRVVESYSVLSGSMLPTLQPEDRILGNRLAYKTWYGRPASAKAPRRGDIVVFKSSAADHGNLTDVPEYLVKRVIGVPGDRISMRGGIPVINGWTVPVCDAAEYLYVLQGGDNGLSGRLLVEFLEDRVYLTVHAAGSAAFAETYEVQPGEVFVLGDNRNNSSDSRAWNDHHGGGVAIDAVEARMQWFFAGRRPDRNWDFGRWLRPLDSLATQVHLDGVNLRPFQEGIAKCMQKRPEKTSPPAPNLTESSAKAAAVELGR